MALGRNIDRIERNIESIESKFAKISNGRKIARVAWILTIFGRNRSSRRNLSFQKFSKERKIIESIESIDSIGRSTDRSNRSTAAVITHALNEHGDQGGVHSDGKPINYSRNDHSS